MNADVHMMVNSGVFTASTSTASGTGDDDASGIGQKRPHSDEFIFKVLNLITQLVVRFVTFVSTEGFQVFSPLI